MSVWAKRLSIVAVACSLGFFQAKADDITYVVTTTASGTLGGRAFTNAGLTVTLTGDTAGILSLDPSVYFFSLANPGLATVVVSGVGAATLTDPMYAVSTLNTPFNGLYGVGIEDPAVSTLVDAVGVPLKGYNLATPLNFSGSGGLGNGGGAENIFPTTAGNLEFVRQQPPIFVPATVTAVLTSSLTGYEGGPTSAPAFLIGSTPVGEVTGTISGLGSEDYYVFNWSGGAFAATASLTGASSGASYLFSAGVAGSCNSVGSQNLNSGDGFSGIISAGDLAPGQYCIGLDANSANDPNFKLTFDTPVSPVPEPGTFVLLSGGVAAIALVRRRK